MKKKIKYTECDKLEKVSKDSQKIEKFLNWLRNEKEFVISEYTDNENNCDCSCDCDGDCDCGESEILVPANRSIDALLADYFKIDMDKVEEERRAILSSLNK